MRVARKMWVAAIVVAVALGCGGAKEAEPPAGTATTEQQDAMRKMQEQMMQQQKQMLQQMQQQAPGAQNAAPQQQN